MSPDARTLCRITAIVNRDFVQRDTTVKTLKACGVTMFTHTTGRALMLRERSGLSPALLRRPAPLVSSPLEMVSFYVNPLNEAAALATIADRFNLYIPGSGSVYSEQVTLLGGAAFDPVNSTIFVNNMAIHMQSGLCGICCIVMRGLGDAVARVALETGSCVPAVTWGEGAGLRDRLGLWRILIPAEKEIITMVVNAWEAEEIMDIIIDVARIDEPGRGIIFLYPVRQGLINLKVSQSSRSQAASIEQVILAIDELKGSAEWRRRVLTSGSGASDLRKKHRTNLTECALHCERGRGADFVRIAMESGGAPGGTTSGYTYLVPPRAGLKKISPARELCSMIVDAEQAPSILASLENALVLDNKNIVSVETREILRAYSSGTK